MLQLTLLTLKIGARHRIPLLWKVAGERLGERLATLLPETILSQQSKTKQWKQEKEC